jgi:hypothetical protein
MRLLVLASLWLGDVAVAHDRFPLDLDGQLARLAAELPCPFDADTWKLSNDVPSPLRVPCSFTGQTFATTRALWSAAVDNAIRIPLAGLRADALRYAGLPYLFSGRVRAVSLDVQLRTHVRMTLADGHEVEAVGNDYGMLLYERELADVVGYLAGWSDERERLPLLATAALLAAGEVARAVEQSAKSDAATSRGAPRALAWNWHLSRNVLRERSR